MSSGAVDSYELSDKPETKMYTQSFKHSARTLRKPRQFACSKYGNNITDGDKLQSDEEADKSHSDALWADFLSDVSVGSKTTQKTDDAGKGVNIISKPEVKLEEAEHTLNNLVIKKKQTEHILGSRPVTFKRPLCNEKIGSLINKSEKKKKLSLLEKSQMDWKNFKKYEGIDEQLRTYNKGKDGYLDRQEFLERTDLRQFEIERNLRQSRRPN
ncbi:craniofacial development protein 1 isoform X1 [Drosophila subpulchrella]|uniref:craniofacial development protein 1 isoform X1 n=1 Tax=Drosophila subpulchrella TaxID=1486046 RepID=UPI0018A1AC61|nr:craniofacial development protein 1 isoform X1 [Drosophila subpulchrella]